MSVTSISSGTSMLTASEVSLRQSPVRGSQRPGFRRAIDSASQTDVAERIIAFLRRRHPLKTADSVAVETGVPAGTVQKWLDRGSAPSVPHFLRLAGAYGPDFLCVGFSAAPAWLDRAVREERAAQLKAEIAAREAMLARLSP